MKLRLLLILSFVATLSAYADDARIVIKQKSGGETILELAFNPVITFSGDNMVVTSSLTTISIPLADIDKYTTYNDTTAILSPTDAPRLLTVMSYSAGYLLMPRLESIQPMAAL